MMKKALAEAKNGSKAKREANIVIDLLMLI
jgi:hypothetical protein